MAEIWLKKQIAPRISNGHPWIYANEIGEVKGSAAGGDIVDVYYFNGKLAGRGYFNPLSQIQVRLLSRKQEPIDAAFFQARIRKAWEYRKKLGYTENCRLVFGEADDLPALIIDKFNDVFVLQTLSLGMDKWKQAIVDALIQIFSPRGIYERNDVPVRELEGLPQQKGPLCGDFGTDVPILENGLQFLVDVANGQKTGHFLDQQDNRRAIAQIVKDADVLGVFTYTGTFEIHAAHYGARSVLGLDVSEQAVERARVNAALNGLEGKCNFQASNAFDTLKQWGREGKKFDVVMLDPPAFTKSRIHINKALTGYKEINLRGIQLIRDGGFLVSSSCTNLVSEEQFLQTIEEAAKDAKKKVRQVLLSHQSGDHPIVRGLENTHYLKFFIAEISSR
ncbi:MAG: class I SAM-dependent rRNA methyltransferase [Bacteroidota bacterium]|jgi:23S rRNA (cytosine1962-C5)-methyltransferase